MLRINRKTPPTETLAMIMNGISDFSSSKVLTSACLECGGGWPEILKLLTHQTNVFQPSA